MFSHLLDQAFPGSCLLCARPRRRQSADLCRECRDELPWLQTACIRCGEPLLLPPGTRASCGHCLAHPPRLQDSVAIFRYRFPLDRLIQRFKFEGGLVEGRLLAELFVAGLRLRNPDRPDLLLPVPLHTRRQRQRGFNQAEWLAKAAGKALDIPVDAARLRRLRDTPVQSGLDRRERRRNLHDAFAVAGRLPPHVAIVDDVATTGTTLEEIARILPKHGVERVDAWLLARTPRERD